MSKPESKLISVELDEPITRGDDKVATLHLRRPGSGDLRGLSLMKLGQADVTEILRLLPRITVPPITQAEADVLDSADMMELADKVTDFFMSRHRRASLPTT